MHKGAQLQGKHNQPPKNSSCPPLAGAGRILPARPHAQKRLAAASSGCRTLVGRRICPVVCRNVQAGPEVLRKQYGRVIALHGRSRKQCLHRSLTQTPNHDDILLSLTVGQLQLQQILPEPFPS